MSLLPLLLRPRVLLLSLLGLLLPPAVQAQSGQTWQWAQGLSADQAAITHVVLGARQDVTVAGTFRGRLVLGATTLQNTEPVDAFFVGRLSASGQWQWAVQSQHATDLAVRALAVSATGDVLLGGYFASTALAPLALGPFALSSLNQNRDFFVARLTGATGQWQWAVRGGSSGGVHEADAVGAVTFDPATDEALVAGDCQGSVGSVGTTSLPGPCLFVGRLGPAGQWTTVATVPVPGLSTPSTTLDHLALSPTGEVTLVGRGIGTVAFGTHSLTLASALAHPNPFVARLGANGQWAWATSVAGPGDESVSSLALDAANNAYLAGRHREAILFGAGPLALAAALTYDPFVARLDGATGQWQWVSGLQGAANEDIAGLAPAPGGGFLTFGSLANPVAFGATVLTGDYAHRHFVARLSEAGTWERADLLASPTPGVVYAAHLLATGELAIGGSFGNAVQFGSALSLTGVPNAANGFVARSSVPLGLAPDQPATRFTLAPNPAHHHVSLLNAPAGPVELLDGRGRVVRTQPATTTTPTTLDLRGLPASLYLVRAAGQTRRLVVE